MTLPELRDSIDRVDARIVQLLHERAELVRQVGRIKEAESSPIFVPERESALYAKLERLNEGKLPEESLKAVYREIISCGYALEGGFKVAYLGPEGTWSHQAAIRQFGSSVELIPCACFKDVFDAVERGNAAYGVVPMENSTHGAVAQVMDLFVSSPLKICAQMHLPIRNCLLGNLEKGRIKTIYSHPQIIGQCRRWIDAHFPGASLVETSSSTAAARMAAERAHEGAAAIGGKLAGELAGLDILESNIQDKPHNVTRFAVIGHQKTVPTGADRTSLCFTVRHEAGSLVQVLEQFRQAGISLQRIESRPSKVVDWEYVFYVDAEGHADAEPLKACLQNASLFCSLLKVFGSYPETLPPATVPAS